MKNTILFSALFVTPLFANALTLQCEFLPQAHLPQFKIVLTETAAQLSFEGDLDLVQDLDPSGESVTLMRRRSSEGWVAYSGQEVIKTTSPCNYTFNGECAAPARGFDLSFSQDSLSSKKIEGHLQFSPLSDYLPAEAYYSHSIACARVK